MSQSNSNSFLRFQQRSWQKKLTSSSGSGFFEANCGSGRLFRAVDWCKPRVGTRIYMPAPQDVRERYVVREALESQSVRLFSAKATARERMELCRMAEHMGLI